jgi:hypothetical protein
MLILFNLLGFRDHIQPTWIVTRLDAQPEFDIAVRTVQFGDLRDSSNLDAKAILSSARTTNSDQLLQFFDNDHVGIVEGYPLKVEFEV